MSEYCFKLLSHVPSLQDHFSSYPLLFDPNPKKVKLAAYLLVGVDLNVTNKVFRVRDREI